MRNRKKGFTLIELIAVLVILAVIALIVTPLVLNIVKKAKDSASKRSVDAYGKATELAIATYLLDNGDYPTTLDNLTVEYSGNEVICNVKTLNEDGSIYLSECTVKGTEVKDSKTDDGWYHYGKIKNLTYEEYKIGDQVTYNGMDFYVIGNSDETSESVTLLKAEPLTVDEVNTYGAGHVNMYRATMTTLSYYQKAYDQNGYGGLVYYSSPTCGYDAYGNNYTDGCKTDYDESEVKYVVDAWATDKFNASDLTEDGLGYKARLITADELVNNFAYVYAIETYGYYKRGDGTPSWVYNEKYSYWTMSACEDYVPGVWIISDDSYGRSGLVYYNYNIVVRPVITLLKSALQTTLSS